MPRKCQKLLGNHPQNKTQPPEIWFWAENNTGNTKWDWTEQVRKLMI